MRKLIGLMALIGALGVFVVSAPAAGASVVGEPEVSPQSESQCSSNTMCIWGGTTFFEGPFGWWPASNTGCHNHANIPKVYSAWNRTGYTVRMGGQGNIGPGVRVVYGTPVTGEICWPA